MLIMLITYAAIVSSLKVISANCQLLSEFPQDVIQDWTSILINGTVQKRDLCNIGISVPMASLTEYWIYTRDDPSTPVIVKEPDIRTTASRSKIVFISHGWLQNPNAPEIASIKDAYLVRYDAYVVSINWEAYSKENYFCADLALPAIADNVASFMCRLKQNNNISLEDIHIVGHSLGAHLFGHVGSLVREKCGVKVGRITGLDPAGPLYGGVAPIFRLDPTDAHFVDVIHTASGTAGHIGSLGHLDSYANCGYVQPGCVNLPILDIESILKLPVEVVTCNHARSCYYFAESINSNEFVAENCIGCGVPICSPAIFGNTRQIIGEDNTKPGTVRDYVFYTNPSKPYAKG